jgi:hypothetical protein
LPPGALLLIFFKNGFGTGKSPCILWLAEKKNVAGGAHVEVVH